MLVSEGTRYDLKHLQALAIRTSRWANQIRKNLKPTESVALEEMLQTVADDSLELYYLVSQAVNEAEEEE